MLRVSDIMTTSVVTVSPDLGLRDAMDLFVDEHISGAPVVEGHRVVGVVSATDLMALVASLPGSPTERGDEGTEAEWEAPELLDRHDEPEAAFFTEMWDDAGADVAERTATPSSPEWNVLDEHTVGEAMTRNLCCIRADTDVPAAADYLQQHGIHRALVMDGDALLGILTTSDIANAVAEHKLTDRRYVFGKARVLEDRTRL